jgi:hypothetical protein
MARKRPTSNPKNEPLVPVDPSLKAAWTKLAAQIDGLSKHEASDFDALWEAVDRVVSHDPPLYLFGGFKNATEFFAERLHVDLRTATRNIRVARYASPADEAAYGASNIDAALGFLEAKNGPLGGTLPVSFARLRIPVPDGRHVKLAAFADLSKAQIQGATRALLDKKSPAPKNPARAALEATLGKHMALGKVVVHERAGYATFANVPLASLDLFARALVRTKLPDVAPAKAPKGKGRKRAQR